MEYVGVLAVLLQLVLCHSLALSVPGSRTRVSTDCRGFLHGGSSLILLDRVFTSNMVLQHDRPCIRGISVGIVTVSVVGLEHAAVEAVPEKGCRFLACLPARPTPSVTPVDVVLKARSSDESRGRNRSSVVLLRNVLFGDVYFCFGQSNMGWPLDAQARSEGEARSSRFPWRGELLQSLRQVAFTLRVFHRELGWMHPQEPDLLAKFSATCWFFGVELQRRLRDRNNSVAVPPPVGLLHAALPGVPLVAFLDPKRIRECPEPSCQSLHPGPEAESPASGLWGEARDAPRPCPASRAVSLRDASQPARCRVVPGGVRRAEQLRVSLPAPQSALTAAAVVGPTALLPVHRHCWGPPRVWVHDGLCKAPAAAAVAGWWRRG
eukprot:RCo049281